MMEIFLSKQHLHRRGGAACFFPLKWMNHTNYENVQTVQCSLTSSLFSPSFSLFIHCNSHSLLPPPLTTTPASLCGPLRGGRYNGGIDTGDPMRSARSLRPCFSFHGWVKHLWESPGGYLCRCWLTKASGSVGEELSGRNNTLTLTDTVLFLTQKSDHLLIFL